MLARSSAEIDSPMDTSLDMEDDMLEIDMNGDIDDNEDIEDQDADADIILLDDKVPEVFNFETDLQDVVSFPFGFCLICLEMSKFRVM